MREIHDFLFEKSVEGMTAEEVLNYYRNLYHAEPQSTEHGIVAKALNDILPRMILPPCKAGAVGAKDPKADRCGTRRCARHCVRLALYGAYHRPLLLLGKLPSRMDAGLPWRHSRVRSPTRE